MKQSAAKDPSTGEQIEVIDLQMYALNLAEDGRILSATEDKYGTEGQPRVEELPTGETEAEKDISNYKYINGEYIYAPLWQIAPIEIGGTSTVSTAEADMMGLIVDHEYRLTLLELGVAE